MNPLAATGTKTRSNTPILLGGARLVTVLLALMFATSDPEFHHFTFESELDDLGAAAYLGFGLLALGLATWSWWWTERLFPALLVLDLTAFVVIPIGVEPNILAYSALSSIFGAFIIIETALMRGLRQACIVAVIANILCFLTCLPLSAHDFHMAVPDMVRRVVLLQIVSVFTLWACHLFFARTAPYPEATGLVDRPAIERQLLGHFMTNLRASGAILCWAVKSQTVSRPAFAGSSVGPPEPELLQTAWLSDHRAVLFDLNRNRALVLDVDGSVSAQSPASESHKLAARLNLEQGIAMKLTGTLVSGWIVLTGLAGANRDNLERGANLSHDAATSLDTWVARNQAVEVSKVRLREVVARDLHDSVA